MEQKHFGSNTGGTNAPFFDGSQVCAQIDPDLFFPENSSDTRLNIQVARKICGSCEFSVPCLEYALEHRELLGIWSGTTETQRWKIRARRKVA